MCKKLMFLISFVFVLSMVTSAYATPVYTWTNDYPWSQVYASPWNWDPVAPYGGPGDLWWGDEASITGGGTLIMDSYIHPFYIWGPHDLSEATTVYVIKDAYVSVYGWNARDGSGSLVPTLIVADDAQVNVNGSMRFWDSGNGRIELHDNARFIVADTWRFGDGGSDTDYIEFIMDGESYLEVANHLHMGRDETAGMLDFSGNATVVVADQLAINSRNVGYPDSFINISGNADITCKDFTAGNGGGSVIVNMSGGTLIVDNDAKWGKEEGAGRDLAGEHSLYMSGGLIQVAGEITLPDSADGDSFNLFELTGGVIEAGAFNHASDDWLMTICSDAVMILDGDVVDEILEDADAGRIVACPALDCHGGISPRGTLMVEFDTINPGRTRIWQETNLELAWAPQPADGATDVPSIGTILCWCNGENTEVSHLYLGTDEALVAAHDGSTYQGAIHEQNCYDPNALMLCTTYYWTIVEQDFGINLYPGPVWSFTVECCRAIEDFEAYTMNPDYIWDTWKDGCGDVDGLNGNGTGSCVSLSMDVLHGGAKAMTYTYENEPYGIWNRDANYSEATRTFDPPLDLTSTGEAQIIVWFYGDAGNGLTDMWALLNGSVADMATYGDNGEDPADIQSEEWISWHMDLAGFAGVDLSSVATMSIGFGDVVGNVPDSAVGIVRLDDIQTCPVQCIPKFVDHIFDINGDCICDMKDLDIFTDHFLDLQYL